MKINKLTASFGKLENETLTLHDGLNVIYAPNESGKSTWCAFIRAMLYGIDTTQRVRAGYLPDKQRYAPWSGSPMAGTMELTANRCDITITRSTKSKNAPMREFSATYTGTGTRVEGLNGSNAGEELTGVSRDVFCRSAFVEQGTVAFTGSPELEKRINSIVSTGEEAVSYSEADEQLRAWQRKRRYNRRGLLPELEGKIDAARRDLDTMGSYTQQAALLEQRLKKAQEECASLESAVTESRKRQRREALDKLSSAKTVLKQAADEHDAALAEVDTCRRQLQESTFGLKSADDVETEIASELETYEDLKELAAKRVSPLAAVILFILAVACAAVYTFKALWPLVAGAAALGAAAVVLLLRWVRAKHSAEDAIHEQKLLLRKYRVNTAAELSGLAVTHRELYNALSTAEEKERTARTAYENARVRQEQLSESAVQELDFVSGTSEAARLSRELNAARAAAEHISSQLSELNGRMAANGDPLVLASDLSCMEAEYELLEGEYDALSLAIDTLRAADDEIQTRFSPELGKVASRYMASVTGGRYADVFINRDFTVRTRTGDDVIAREAEYLSAGTLDLMYLAVRLAVCELALPEGENCPLIIDDALVNLDETRFEQAMKLLADIAKKRQVILFTCRK